MTVHFSFPQKVLFKHCDPAGIVFYPRFFEMINDAVETLFDKAFDWPFETIHETGAVPTKSFDVDFKRPCRHGDMLRLDVSLLALGRTSLTLEIRAMAGDDLRFTARQVLVHVGPDTRPAPWPEIIQTTITRLMEGTQ